LFVVETEPKTTELHGTRDRDLDSRGSKNRAFVSYGAMGEKRETPERIKVVYANDRNRQIRLNGLTSYIKILTGIVLSRLGTTDLRHASR